MDKKDLIERVICAKCISPAGKWAACVHRRPIFDLLRQDPSHAVDKIWQHSRTRCTAEIID